MKYEEPRLEMLLVDTDVITLSDGGNSGEDSGDWGDFGKGNINSI